MIVVKRRGHTEKFDQKKLYGSVYGACLVAELNEGACEKNADFVTKQVTKELKKYKNVDSKKILKTAAKHLRKKSKDAAFLYETHKDLS